MIGNVKIYAPELKIKDYNRYRSIYCILCTYLSSSLGFMWRMFVNYDITFLLILLNTIATEKEKFYAKCPSRWSREKIYASLNPSTMDYAVFITAFLTEIKCIDWLTDEGFIKRAIAKFFLFRLNRNRKFKRIKEGFIKEYDILKLAFSLHSEKEKENSPFDICCNNFSDCMQEIMLCAPVELASNIQTYLIPILRNLAKQIYIADALKDYAKDTKKARFNLLRQLQFSADPTAKQIYDRIIYILQWIETDQYNTFTKYAISMQNNIDALIENIILYGMNHTLHMATLKFTSGRTIKND